LRNSPFLERKLSVTRNITLYIEKDYAALSQKAAMIFAQNVKFAPTAAYGFATGSTPEGMYEKTVQMHESGEIDFSKLTAFNLDEYYPISGDNPKSYKYFMATKLFDSIGLSPERRNIPDGESKDPKAECFAYEEKINACGGIELQVLGLGNNGHIGFNEPADIFTGATSYVQLSENTIQSNSRFFDKPGDVPRHAITMGIHSIMMAKRIMMLVSGEAKAGILRDALLGPITPLVPASALQLHRDVIVVADKAAATHL